MDEGRAPKLSWRAEPPPPPQLVWDHLKPCLGVESLGLPGGATTHKT